MACCSVALVDPLNCLHRKSSGLTAASYHDFITSNLQWKNNKKLVIKEKTPKPLLNERFTFAEKSEHMGDPDFS